MFVAWGHALGFLYNDPYAEIRARSDPSPRYEDRETARTTAYAFRSVMIRRRSFLFIQADGVRQRE